MLIGYTNCRESHSVADFFRSELFERDVDQFELIKKLYKIQFDKSLDEADLAILVSDQGVTDRKALKLKKKLSVIEKAIKEITLFPKIDKDQSKYYPGFAITIVQHWIYHNRLVPSLLT
jgi:hypothetical protein